MESEDKQIELEDGKRNPEEEDRYILRKQGKMNYMETPCEDQYMYCDECDVNCIGECPIHGPYNIVEDTEVALGAVDRAILTLPKGLAVFPSSIPNAGLGVVAAKFFPKHSRFGPYEGYLGREECLAQTGYSWQISGGRLNRQFIDASDTAISNWTRYVNCARTEEEQNLVAYHHQKQIYYRSFKDIHPGTELLVWYGDGYGRELGVKQCYTYRYVKKGSQKIDTAKSVQSDTQNSRCKQEIWFKIIRPGAKRNLLISGNQKPSITKYTCVTGNTNRFKTRTECDDPTKKLTERFNISKFRKNKIRFKIVQPFNRDYWKTKLQCKNGFNTVSRFSKCSRSALIKSRFKIIDPKIGYMRMKENLKRSGETACPCELRVDICRLPSNLLKQGKNQLVSKIHECQICHVIFCKSYKLSNHIKIHRKAKLGVDANKNYGNIKVKSVSSKQHVCNICKEVFITHKELKSHIISHTEKDSVMCNCDQAFTGKTQKDTKGDKSGKFEYAVKRKGGSANGLMNMHAAKSVRCFKCCYGGISRTVTSGKPMFNVSAVTQVT